MKNSIMEVNKVFEYELPSNREVLFKIKRLYTGYYYIRTTSVDEYGMRWSSADLRMALKKICLREDRRGDRKFPKRIVCSSEVNLYTAWRVIKELGLDPVRVLRGED